MKLLASIILAIFIQIHTASQPIAAYEAPGGGAPGARNSPTNNEESVSPELQQAQQQVPPPSPLPAASYLSSDGLTLVIVFDRPVNLSASIESVERRRVFESGEQAARLTYISKDDGGEGVPAPEVDVISADNSDRQNQRLLCQEPKSVYSKQRANHDTQHLIQGIQLCAKLLSKKTLKLLHKFRLHNCLWPSQVQFIIQLGKPIGPSNQPIKVAFQRGTIGAVASTERSYVANDREINVELNKLPLETLGVPLAPRLALTGPNQVPPCGQFSLTAHLSSPYGTQAGESVQVSWSVEKIGFVHPAAAPGASGTQSPPTLNSTTGEGSSSSANQLIVSESQQQVELKWRALQHLVAASRTNNLVLDAELFQFVPQLYQFQVSATFTTNFATITLNATHQIGRLDYETPMGTIYGSHLLSQQQELNTNQELLLLADVQVPECASNIKQVGLYWQVSDPRVRFDQTYAPYYLARANTLPDQSLIEFRLNLFYGIRVKKFSSAGTFVRTGESALDSQISNGLLIMTIGQDPSTAGGSGSNWGGQQLELYGFTTDAVKESEKFTHQWSCFDGKTAQACSKSARVIAASNNTRYDIGSSSLAINQLARPTAPAPGDPTSGGSSMAPPTSAPLIDRARQGQPILRLPMSWLEPDAQLWFGLQRFDKQNPSQQSQTEYTLVSVQPGPAPMVAIGPVLIGRSRQRATIRNPLTGSVILVAGASTVVVGRLGPRQAIKSFMWHSPNLPQPLHWTTKNVSNPVSGQEELYSELHLSPSLQVAYAHYELQLIACSDSGTTVAALHIDIVQGVSQCRVETSKSPLTGGLVVSVNYCNIPLGLSPISYQIYLADTSASEGFISEARPALVGASGSDSRGRQEEDEYTNETDEAYLESLAQPMSVSQLSPVFSLGNLGAETLLGLLNVTSHSQPASIRFVARVCDRLQTCRMFYSAPLGAKQLQLMEPTAVADQTSARLAAIAAAPTPELRARLELEVSRNRAQSVVMALQAMSEGARRANTAGNSIAAIAILNGVIQLTQRLLLATQQMGGKVNAAATTPPAALPLTANTGGVDERARDLLQAAMRDCLHYGAQSIQRQFHYTDPGQTNLVTHTLGRILSAPQSSIEFKFKAMRLMAQLTKRAINEQVNLKLNCLADAKSIQLGYESLFGTFSHYSIDANDNNNNNNNNTNNNNQPATTASLIVNNLSVVLSNSTAQATTATTTANRKKREEAVLAYLKSVRLAYRALISAAAIQLPLGGTQQFQYSRATDPEEPDLAADKLISSRAAAAAKSGRSQPLAPSASAAPSTSYPSLSKPLPQIGAQLHASPADIVSSLAHLTELTANNTIEIDLHEFGFVTLKFNQDSVNKLRAQLSARQLRCKNDTITKCSSFVLAITSFAGKAPFRSLDLTRTLSVPILEVSLLSPVDGSNLLDLASQQTTDGSQGGSDIFVPLSAQDFTLSVTFTIPKTDADSFNNTEPLKGSASSESPHRRRYKCYQFNEDSNEWYKAPLSERHDVETLGEDRKIISCTFAGLGVFGAFQGKPPPAEASMSSPVILALLVVISLAVLFSLYACFASSSSSHEGDEHDARRMSHDGALDDKQAVEHPHLRRTEQSYRNDFNNYPL